jgi:hypothetical protein
MCLDLLRIFVLVRIGGKFGIDDLSVEDVVELVSAGDQVVVFIEVWVEFGFDDGLESFGSVHPEVVV